MVTMDTVRAILDNGEISGGETCPETGDMVQVRMPDGIVYNLYLSKTFGDELPTREQIMETVEAVGRFPTPRWEAEPVEDHLKSITATLKVGQHGNALSLSCTKELKALGLDRGDMVRVTFERI